MNPAQMLAIERNKRQARDAKAYTWTREYQARAKQEGWYLAFEMCYPEAWKTSAKIRAKSEKRIAKWAERNGIPIKTKRNVETVILKNDREACELVGQLADAGAEHAKVALAIIARKKIENAFT